MPGQHSVVGQNLLCSSLERRCWPSTTTQCIAPVQRMYNPPMYNPFPFVDDDC